MEHRVGRLQLNIRGPAGQDRDLPRFAEQFSRNVLERFCQIVEDRFPGRDFVIRRMDLRCSLSPEQLIDVAEAVRYAAALAATIVVPDADETIAGVPRANTAEVSGHTETQEQQNQAEPVDPSPAHALDDVVEWILSCLRAEVRGAHDAWVQAWLRDMGSQPVGHFALCQRAITAALAQLDAADAMIETLAALSPRTTWAPARGWLRVSGRRFRLARTRRCRGGQRDRSLPADLAGHRRRAAGPGFPVSAGRFRPLTTFRRPCRHNLMPAAHRADSFRRCRAGAGLRLDTATILYPPDGA